MVKREMIEHSLRMVKLNLYCGTFNPPLPVTIQIQGSGIATSDSANDSLAWPGA